VLASGCRAGLKPAAEKGRFQTRPYLMNWFLGKFAVAITPPSTTSG
jgi:hypothetical protein